MGRVKARAVRHTADGVRLLRPSLLRAPHPCTATATREPTLPERSAMLGGTPKPQSVPKIPPSTDKAKPYSRPIAFAGSRAWRLCHAEAGGQFSSASAAQCPRFVELDYLHDRDDNLVNVLTTVANKQRLSAHRTHCNGRIGSRNLRQCDG